MLLRAAMRLGVGEMLVVLVIALLVFGPSKLPQLGDALGKGIRNFKRASEGDEPDASARPEQLPSGSVRSPGAPAAGSTEPSASEARR